MKIKRKLSATALVIVLSSSACRFVLPDFNEGQTLARRGAFPSELPTWVKPLADQDIKRPSSSGMIPLSYGTPGIVRSAQTQAGDSDDKNRKKDRRKLAGIGSAASNQAGLSTAGDGGDSDSPLDRILELCPGIESGVSEALRTESAKDRIAKYNSLTLRCPNSSDLWFWLGKDYESLRRYSDAIRSYERVLALEPENKAAKVLLKVVKERAANPETS